MGIIFDADQATARALLAMLASFQGMGGFGVITLVTTLLRRNGASNATKGILKRRYVLCPLIFHGIAALYDVLLLSMLGKPCIDIPSTGHSHSIYVDVALLLALLAFSGLVWFLVKTFWLDEA